MDSSHLTSSNSYLSPSDNKCIALAFCLKILCISLFISLIVKNNLFYWGKNDQGAFGDNLNKDTSNPALNEVIASMKKQEQIKLIQIKASG